MKSPGMISIVLGIIIIIFTSVEYYKGKTEKINLFVDLGSGIFIVTLGLLLLFNIIPSKYISFIVFPAMIIYFLIDQKIKIK
ncbi:MAG TPA: hypothetical protein DDY58_05750 [Terrisporobacter glycolicus]|uniref:Uncharacterized protein n=2 Tax=Terrisporobacter TaxID=1505652 RepID=A0AAX2ZET3_9FIRM|nr:MULTISPECIES: hypothetical protein [Terrisporobacter]MBN9645664.1 hypothetical protein [Terrisporobacter glycolicus]UEL47762.1 hypothetical protein JW646_19445 [Terrisporobacter hibernicus]UPA32240.1 hypothetical protein L0P85_08925 [Terrisporobacter glycolicus]SFJ21352.1 hypothetical protein SAMN02910355_1580 [Terrisporobacter glycolicus]HBI91966.1 hypothetical protein [Terrisporobacter hibernicus]